MRTMLLLAWICVCAGLGPAWAEEAQEGLVGSITSVEGTVSVIREGETLTVEKGTRLFKDDVVKTGEKSSVGIVLRDDSTLSLGPSSELTMSEFTFKPDEGTLSMTLKIVKGTLAYVSGQISKLAPGAVQVETPEGVAAVRGTELLVEVK